MGDAVSTMDFAEPLRGEKHLLARSGTAERVATILRRQITEGVFPPGTRLSEPAIGAALGVSRNTLREAFQLLAHERLAVHELNRGVFVRELTAADIRDLYQARRMIEGAAIRQAAEREHVDTSALALAVADGRSAAEAEQWRAVGTASMHFHQAVADLAGSERISATARQVLAETRLFFVLAEHTRAFFEPYIKRHQRIVSHLDRGRFDLAERALEAYLRAAEKQLLAAYERRAGP
ncbi:GntR family transcriptional regulator [Amycolatopsis anabasis]|uniref:GntR family transcriptional regulator n=1 Tax=Amycolatopsis anabasis TaxID=1840409 RepID=UPI001C55252A|nr:GntR family transcriptional regulator [Amycolatopsis anabasis]